MSKSKDLDDAFIEKMCHKFADIADTIPADQWGFDPQMFELLREKRHEVVNKAVSSKLLKSMSKKDKTKLGRELGPVKCNTVTEIISWIGKTHLSKMGIPKKPQNLMNKNNGIVKEKDPEAIAKASKEKRQKQKESRKKNTKKQAKSSKGKIQKKKEKVKKVKKVKPAKKKNRGGALTSA